MNRQRLRSVSLAMVLLLVLATAALRASSAPKVPASIGDFGMTLTSTHFQADLLGTIVFAGKVFAGKARVGSFEGPPNWSFDYASSTGTIGPVALQRVGSPLQPALSGSCTASFWGAYYADMQPRDLSMRCSGRVGNGPVGARSFSVTFFSWTHQPCSCEPTYPSEGVYLG